MNTKKLLIIGLLLISVGFGLYLNLTNKAAPVPDGELVLYSGRSEPLMLPIVADFEKESGIAVTVKSGSTHELGTLLLQEKDKTPADVYIGTDAGWLQKLSKAGLFTPITTDALISVDPSHRAADDMWTGVSGRSRVLIVNTDMVQSVDYPSSVYELTDPKWADKVGMARLSNESVVTHLSALRVLHGDDFLRSFLQGLKDNGVTILQGHTDVRKAVGRGEFSVGLVNHYYGHLQIEETGNVEIIYPDQGDDQDGAFVNVSGVGILAASEKHDLAQKFVEYLLSEGAQEKFAALNFEYPLVQGIEASNAKKLGEFKRMDVDLFQIADELAGTESITAEFE